jgi:hypothetical protein
MAPRAYWKGYLKLSLVSCPIALFPATSEREKISFHQLNKKTGHRIKYRKVDAETGDEACSADITKKGTTSSLIPRRSLGVIEDQRRPQLADRGSAQARRACGAHDRLLIEVVAREMLVDIAEHRITFQEWGGCPRPLARESRRRVCCRSYRCRPLCILSPSMLHWGW